MLPVLNPKKEQGKEKTLIFMFLQTKKIPVQFLTAGFKDYKNILNSVAEFLLHHSVLNIVPNYCAPMQEIGILISDTVEIA